jgi:hypothetical protein
VVLMLYGAQFFILFLQGLYGPRFFMPKDAFPRRHDYF